MEKVTGIGGLFFKARDPAALAAWYRDTLGVDDVQSSIWQQQAGPTVLSPFALDSDYFGRPDQLWMINFRVADLDAMLAQLRALGIEAEQREAWDSPEVGRFARIHDPEGNPIELWQPAPQG